MSALWQILGLKLKADMQSYWLFKQLLWHGTAGQQETPVSHIFKYHLITWKTSGFKYRDAMF